jgi:hypothetical protein
VALSYRQLVELVAAGRIDSVADALAKLDAHWCELEQGWIRPTLAPLDPDAWMPPRELAELLHIAAHDFRNWYARGHIRRSAQGEYNVGDVIRYYSRIRYSRNSERDCAP